MLTSKEKQRPVEQITTHIDVFERVLAHPMPISEVEHIELLKQLREEKLNANS